MTKLRLDTEMVKMTIKYIKCFLMRSKHVCTNIKHHTEDAKPP